MDYLVFKGLVAAGVSLDDCRNPHVLKKLLLQANSLAEGERHRQDGHQRNHGDVGEGTALERAAVFEEATSRDNKQTAEGVATALQRLQRIEVGVPNLVREEVNDRLDGFQDGQVAVEWHVRVSFDDMVGRRSRRGVLKWG